MKWRGTYGSREDGMVTDSVALKKMPAVYSAILRWLCGYLRQLT